MEAPEELTRTPRALQSNEELDDTVRQNLDKVQQWYRELQRAKIAEMQTLVIAGKPQEALETLRTGDVLQPGVRIPISSRLDLPYPPVARCCIAPWAAAGA